MKRTAARSPQKRLAKLSNTALDCLEDILTDDTAKTADRISAVKLTFELMRQQAAPAAPEAPEAIRVIFEPGTEDWAG
ncbi:MAG: hypothetical protein K6G56_07420 [Clostridiales bacterium]|nr:hypothetical protein [Clostridiales bacterium]